MTDPTADQPLDPAPAAAWVTVADAAERAGVSTRTVRHWYRSARLPTQRAEGERGAFLVPLEAVIALAEQADATGDAYAAEVIDLNADYWSAETKAAREEAATLRQELAAARAALDEVTDERNDLATELVRTRAELERLREISTAVASITDNSWLDLPTNSYRSPVRPQGMPVPDERPSEVVGAASEPAVGAPGPGVEGTLRGGAEPAPEDDADATRRPDAAPARGRRHAFGNHGDDLLPRPEKKGRRGRR